MAKRIARESLQGNKIHIESEDVMKNLETVFEDLVSYWDDIPVCK
jgi:hypothetical protein